MGEGASFVCLFVCFLDNEARYAEMLQSTRLAVEIMQMTVPPNLVCDVGSYGRGFQIRSPIGLFHFFCFVLLLFLFSFSFGAKRPRVDAASPPLVIGPTGASNHKATPASTLMID